MYTTIPSFTKSPNSLTNSVITNILPVQTTTTNTTTTITNNVSARDLSRSAQTVLLSPFTLRLHTYFRIIIVIILCLCFRASLIYTNNCPTRCNTKQFVYYSASSLYMFWVTTTPIILSTQNCNYSLRCWSATSLQRSQVGHVGGR